MQKNPGPTITKGEKVPLHPSLYHKRVRGRKRKERFSLKVPKARQVSSGAWFIQLRLGGESITITDRAERACTKQAQFVKAEYLAGKRAPKEEAPAKLPTLGEGMDAYINENEYALSPATVRGYDMIRKHRFPELMVISMSDLTAEVCKAALTNAKKKYAPKTIKNSWAFVETVLRYHKVEPPEGVSLPQVPKNKRPFLDSEQILVFLAAVVKNKYAIPILLALLSLRRSELKALDWRDIDLKHRRIRVQGAVVMDRNSQWVHRDANKNETSTRYVPIFLDELYDLLEKNWQPSGPVVTCNPNTVWRNAKKVCREAGLPEVGTHGLRHSFASLAVSLGMPEEYTMVVGGWSDIQTMKKIYIHISNTDMERYNEALSGYKTAGKNAN